MFCLKLGTLVYQPLGFAMFGHPRLMRITAMHYDPVSGSSYTCQYVKSGQKIRLPEEQVMAFKGPPPGYDLANIPTTATPDSVVASSAELKNFQVCLESYQLQFM